jgi:hypothetical protein
MKLERGVYRVNRQVLMLLHQYQTTAHSKITDSGKMSFLSIHLSLRRESRWGSKTWKGSLDCLCHKAVTDVYHGFDLQIVSR